MNILIIILTLNCFDDEFLRNLIPKFFYKFFGLNIQKEIKVKKPKIISMIENLQNLKKKNSNNLNNENEITNKQNNENEYENDENYFYHLEEDLEIKKSKQNSILYEIMIFFNLITLYVLFIFLYLIPLKEIMMNEVKFNTTKVNEFYRKYMVYFCHLVFATFIYYFIKAYLEDFFNAFILNDEMMIKETMNNLKNENIGVNSGKFNKHIKAKNGFVTVYENCLLHTFNFLKLFKNFVVLIFLIFYFISSSKTFYRSLNIDYNTDIKIATLEKHFNYAFAISDKFFNNLRVLHNYNILTEYQSKYIRYELEIKFNNSDNNKDKLDNYALKRFGVSDNNNLTLFNLYFPRLDYMLYKSGLSEDLNQNIYLAILCGKIIERNPITLDLLKYRTRSETNIISKKIFSFSNKLKIFFYFIKTN